MPNRILRDWTDSDRVNQLTTEGERFFTRLIMKVDDYGRFYADPRRLRSACFPLKDSIRDTDITRWLAECEKAGLVRHYEAAGSRYLCIPNFGQRLRQMKERFPAPPVNPGEKATDPNLSVVRPSTDRHLPAPFVSVSVSQPLGDESPREGAADLPRGFPPTSAEAITHAAFVGCPVPFALTTWNKAMGRGGRDARECAITSFRHHLASEWAYEQERQAKQSREKGYDTGKTLAQNLTSKTLRDTDATLRRLERMEREEQ